MKLPDVSQKMYYDPDYFHWFSDLSMIWWRQSYRYASNWRMLHVDGLEGFIFSQAKRPASTRKPKKFFTYAEEA